MTADALGPDRPPTAKRDRVRRHLLNVIEKAGPGTGLASERDLAQELGVSRPTVRAAIDELTRTGLLVRQRGRGTFTSPHKVTQELAYSAAGSACRRMEGNWTSEVVAFTTAPASAPRAARLEVAGGAPVLRVTRVRYVDEEPIAIERLDLPAELVPGLAAKPTWRPGTSTGCCGSGSGSPWPRPSRRWNRP